MGTVVMCRFPLMGYLVSIVHPNLLENGIINNDVSLQSNPPYCRHQFRAVPIAGGLGCIFFPLTPHFRATADRHPCERRAKKGSICSTNRRGTAWYSHVLSREFVPSVSGEMSEGRRSHAFGRPPSGYCFD